MPPATIFRAEGQKSKPYSAILTQEEDAVIEEVFRIREILAGNSGIGYIAIAAESVNLSQQEVDAINASSILAQK